MLSPVSRVNKPRDRHYKHWKENNLFLACKDVSKGKYTYRQAAEMYRVPRSTIWDRVSGKLAFGAHSGPPRYLDDNEEEEFVKCLVGSARILFARRKKEVLSIVRATVAKKQGCDIDKVTVTPGYWSSFVKRHPHLSLRSGSKLAYQPLLLLLKL